MNKIKQTIKSLSLAVAGWMGVALIAQAQATTPNMISVNFHGGDTSASDAIPGDGLVPAQVWTNIVNEANGTVKTDLELPMERALSGMSDVPLLSYKVAYSDSNSNLAYTNILRGAIRGDSRKCADTSVSESDIKSSTNLSWIVVENIPFAFYDVVVSQARATTFYCAPSLNGLNLTGDGRVQALARVYSNRSSGPYYKPVESDDYEDTRAGNTIYARLALTSSRLKMWTQATFESTVYRTYSSGIAAFQIVEVPSDEETVNDDCSWSALGLTESETRVVKVLTVAAGKTLSVGSAEIETTDELKNLSYFINFGENGKLDLTLAEGVTSVRVRTTDLKPENLTVRLSNGTPAPNVYLSQFDEYLHVSTDALTFGEAMWMTADAVNVKWTWKEEGDATWQTVKTRDQLATMQVTAYFRGLGFSPGMTFDADGQSAAVHGSYMGVSDDAVRFQALCHTTLPADQLDCVKVELRLGADGTVTAKGIESRDYTTSDKALIDLWDKGTSRNVPAHSQYTGFYGIYGVQVKPTTILRDEFGGYHAAFDEAFDYKNEHGCDLTIYDDYTIKANTTFSDNLSVADGKSLTIGSGATLTLGMARVSGKIAFADASAQLVLQVLSPEEVITVVTDSTDISSNVKIIDTTGADITDNYTKEAVEGGWSFKRADINVFEATAATNWDDLPTNGGIIKIQFTGDIDVKPSSARTYEIVVFEGEGTVSFDGALLTADEFNLSAGATLLIDATSGAREIAALLSGDGAVRTRGNVTFKNGNTFKGGLTVESGTVATTAAGGFGAGTVTVLEGASVDVARTGGSCVNTFVIAGTGVNGEGAIFCSAAEAEGVTNQVAGLELTADATIGGAGEWGLMPSATAASDVSAILTQNGFTLTKIGTGNFILEKTVRASGDTNGKIIVESGALTLGNLPTDNVLDLTFRKGSTLRYYNVNKNNNAAVLLDEGTTWEIGVNITAAKKPTIFRLRPSVEHPIVLTGSGTLSHGTNFTNYRIEAALLDVTNEKLLSGESVVLVTNKITSLDLAKMTISNDSGFQFRLGSRFTGGRTKETLTATMNTEFRNLFHYDFDGTDEATWFNNTRGCAAASDSGYLLGTADTWTGVSSPERKPARGKRGNGQAVHLSTGSRKFCPYWSQTTATEVDANRKTIFDPGVATITAVVKPVATGKRYIWSFGQSGNHSGLALVVENANTLKLLGKAVDQAEWTTYAEVSNIPNLSTKEHFVAARFDGRGTTLRVDDGVGCLSASTENVMPWFETTGSKYYGRSGALGTFYNQSSYLGYSSQPSEGEGCYLNDWRFYDAYLTDDELEKIRKEFWKVGFSLIVR